MEKTTTVITHRVEITNENQKRLRILGTSIQKFERSTSFLVAPQVMLYEKRWARMAWEIWIDKPPKKMKLKCTISTKQRAESWVRTYKNGTQLKFSRKAPKKLRCPRRYSKRENERLPAPANTTTQASQISKLW